MARYPPEFYGKNLESGDNNEHINENELRCTWKTCQQLNCQKIWHKPCSFWRCSTIIENLKPILYFTGIWEAIVGAVMVTFVVVYADKIDYMFGTQNSKLISCLLFGGLVTLAVSGMILLVSVLLDKRSLMWIYVFISTFMCMFIVGLSFMMIEMSIYNTPYNEFKESYLRTSTLIGMTILFGSVIHFVGTVAVFTYYNLKYIHPTMFYTIS